MTGMFIIIANCVRHRFHKMASYWIDLIPLYYILLNLCYGPNVLSVNIFGNDLITNRTNAF